MEETREIFPLTNRVVDDGNQPARNCPLAALRSASASGKIHRAPNDRALCATVGCSLGNEFCEAHLHLPHCLTKRAEEHRRTQLRLVRATEKLIHGGPAATNLPSPDKLE